MISTTPKSTACLIFLQLRTSFLSSIHTPNWMDFLYVTPKPQTLLSRTDAIFPPTDLHFPVLPLLVQAKVHLDSQSKALIFLSLTICGEELSSGKAPQSNSLTAALPSQCYFPSFSHFLLGSPLSL